jgi:hypothetical protein
VQRNINEMGTVMLFLLSCAAISMLSDSAAGYALHACATKTFGHCPR